MSDLTERLAEAARNAVLARRAAIEAGSTNLGGVMVEIEVSNQGTILDAKSYLAWQQTVRSVADDPRRLTTEEQWTRLHEARNRGGLCAACGRMLGDEEPVYVEPVVIDIPRPPDRGVGRRRSTAKAPVGVECASPALLARAGGREPARCVSCHRPMYYAATRKNHTRAACSRRCRSRDDVARMMALSGGSE